ALGRARGGGAMSRTRRRLRPCETVAALAALLSDPRAADRLARANGGILLTAFPPGVPRQVAALLACYATSVETHGWPWVFSARPAAFQRLVDAARHPNGCAAERLALAGGVGQRACLALVLKVAALPVAVAWDGRRVLAALERRGVRARRRRLSAADYALGSAGAARSVA